MHVLEGNGAQNLPVSRDRMNVFADNLRADLRQARDLKINGLPDGGVTLSHKSGTAEVLRALNLYLGGLGYESIQTSELDANLGSLQNETVETAPADVVPEPVVPSRGDTAVRGRRGNILVCCCVS